MNYIKLIKYIKKTKRNILNIIAASLAVCALTVFLSSCESIIAPVGDTKLPPAEGASGSVFESENVTAPPETEPPENNESGENEEKETEPESPESAPTSDSAAEAPDTSGDSPFGETHVEEEHLFGNYTPPTTEAETQSPPQPTYSPSYPASTNGTAPLALMYHLILDEPTSSLTNLFVRPSELEGHIQALLEAGYTFIFADEYDYYDTKTVIMSFDDGYVDNYTEMFPIIKKYNVKVTVFMIAGYIGGDGYMTRDMLREMSDSGLVSIQSHTESHPGLTSLSADSLRYEFDASRRELEEITGRKVRAVCYPSGRYNDTVLSVASEYYDFGYTTVSTTSTAGYPILALPRLRVNRGFSKSYFASMIP